MIKEKQVRAQKQKLREHMWKRGGCAIKLLGPVMLPTHTSVQSWTCWGFFLSLDAEIIPVIVTGYFSEMSTMLCPVTRAASEPPWALIVIRWKCFSVLLNPGGLHLQQQMWWCMTSKVRPQEDYGLGLTCNNLETLILKTWLSFCETSQALENSSLAIEWQSLLRSHSKEQVSSASRVSKSPTS